MSRFYAEIKGNRGKASRLGFKESGMWGHIRGWNSGVEVECRVDSEDLDYIEVFATKGSSGYGRRRLIAIVYEDSTVEFIGSTTVKKNVLNNVKQKEDGFTD
jgi:hypothetical protein